MKKEKLKLSYADPFFWWKRTLNIKSREWKILRNRVLQKYQYSCFFCNVKASKYMIIDHISGNATDNKMKNLRVLCAMCDTIRHCGLAGIEKTLIVRKSKLSQLEIVEKTRKLFLKKKKKPEPEEVDPESFKTNFLPIDVASSKEESFQDCYKGFFTKNFFEKKVTARFLDYLI